MTSVVIRRGAAPVGSRAAASFAGASALLGVTGVGAWLLWRLAGPVSIPTSLPRWDEVRAASMATDVSDATLLGIARVVGWTAVAYLDLAVLLRVLAVSAWRLTGMDWAKAALGCSDLTTVPLVRRAADAVLGAALLVSTARPPTGSMALVAAAPRVAVVRQVGTPRRGDAQAPLSSAARQAVTYRVVAGDTLADIARRFYGDATRSTVIADANRGRVMPDGGRFEDPARIEPGWTLEIPLPAPDLTTLGAAVLYRVQPGDSLWAIAERFTGSPFRWPQLFALNRDRDVGSGRGIVDPNLIRPGWELLLPLKAHDLPAVPASARPAAEPSPISSVTGARSEPTASPAGGRAAPARHGDLHLPASPLPPLAASLTAAAAALLGTLLVRTRRRWRRIWQPLRSREIVGDAEHVTIATQTIVGAIRELGCEGARAPVVRETADGIEIALDGPLGGIELLERHRHDLERRLACAVDVEPTGPESAIVRVARLPRVAASLAGVAEGTRALPVPIGASADGIMYLDLAAVDGVAVVGGRRARDELVASWLRTVKGTAPREGVELWTGTGEGAPTAAVAGGLPLDDFEALVQTRGDEQAAGNPVTGVAVVDAVGVDAEDLERVLKAGAAQGIHAIAFTDEQAAVRIGRSHRMAVVSIGADVGGDETAIPGADRITLAVGQATPTALEPVYVHADIAVPVESRDDGSSTALAGFQADVAAPAAPPDPEVDARQDDADSAPEPGYARDETEGAGEELDVSPAADELSSISEVTDAPPDEHPADVQTSDAAPAAESDEDVVRATCVDDSREVSVPTAPTAPGSGSLLVARQEPLPLDASPDEDSEPAAPTRFRVRCFGDFRVEFAGRAPEWRVLKSREILAYLIARGDASVPREEVAEALWSDQPLSYVKHVLEDAAYRLRRGLRDIWQGDDNEMFFTSTGQRYRLHLPLFQIDVDAFNTRLSLADMADGADALEHYERALALYQGDLFEGNYEWDWARPWRLEYHQRFVAAAHAAAAIARDLGDEERVATLYRALLARDPLDEGAARALMECYARADDPNGVRKVYRQLTEALRHGLDDDTVEPGPETREMFRELLEGLGVS